MRGKNLYPYLFISPYLIIYFLFGLFPVLFSLFISFNSWDGMGSMNFAGLQNYIRLFTADRFFYKSLLNTLIVSGVAIPFQLGIGLLTAVMIKNFFVKRRSMVQLLNFLPYITTPVAIAMLFRFLFEQKFGTVNMILNQMGIIKEHLFWLDTPALARTIVIILLIWKYCGYMMVMFTAGLTSIPEELYEASKIDGANWVESFIKITIPMLRPIITFLVVMCIIGGAQLFDEPMMLWPTSLGGPEQSMLTTVMHLYDTAFRRFDFGYGSAIAYGLFSIILVFSIIYMKLMNRGSEE